MKSLKKFKKVKKLTSENLIKVKGGGHIDPKTEYANITGYW